MTPDLSSQNLSISWDEFVQQMYAVERADRPEIVLRQVIRWTKGQPLLTKKLLQYILKHERQIAAGDEATTVEQVIRNRLIKEFKHDELTLSIRKLLYAKDLAKLLKKTPGKITQNTQIYLEDIARELGLSTRQCQDTIEHFASFSSAENQKLFRQLVRPNILSGERDSYQDLVSLIENSPAYYQLTLDKGNSTATSKKRRSNWWQKKTFWFWLIFPWLVLLAISTLARKEELPTIAPADVVGQNGSCQALANIASSRFSLGEELLTATKYGSFPLSSKIALYEATAAFSRCEFAVARKKFAASLTIEKNNPEGLIYFNNARAITKEHLKIAVSVPLGTEPNIAWEILRGVAQAQTEINRLGGIKSKQLMVQVVNDDNEPMLVRQLAKQLASDRQILAVIGHNDSDASLAGSDIYQKQGLVMMSSTSSSTKLSGVGNYIMRSTPSVTVLADTLSSYASVNSLERIAVCSSLNSQASLPFVEEFITEIERKGGEAIDIGCNLAESGFNPIPVVERAVAENADALLLAPSLANIEQAVSVAQANQQRLPLLGNHSLYTSKTTQLGKAAVTGMVLSVPWLPGTIPDSDFPEVSRELWGGEINWRTAMAYDAARAIIQGLQQSDDRAELQSALTQPNFVVDGVTGRFRFQRGDRQGKGQLAYIGKPSASRDYQFLPLKLAERSNSSF